MRITSIKYILQSAQNKCTENITKSQSNLRR
jgi:hypothetical protein